MMKSFDKKTFILLLKVSPSCLLGRDIIYNNSTVKIIDISMDGENLFIEYSSFRRNWVHTDGLDATVVIDILEIPTTNDNFTVGTISKEIETLKAFVGQPGSEPTKPLYEIVAALNKELLELKLKIEEMEKSKTYTASFNK